jgi:hypothetical protein
LVETRRDEYVEMRRGWAMVASQRIEDKKVGHGCLTWNKLRNGHGCLMQKKKGDRPQLPSL